MIHSANTHTRPAVKTDVRRTYERTTCVNIVIVDQLNCIFLILLCVLSLEMRKKQCTRKVVTRHVGKYNCVKSNVA